MEKTITIGKTKVKLDNKVKWLKIYKQQFLHDITPDLIPILSAGLQISEGLTDKLDAAGNVVGQEIENDSLINAVYQLANAELTTVLDITWAMAKCADSSLPEPEDWLDSLEVFPLDEVAPEVLLLAAKGLISTKNLKKLISLLEALKS